MTVFMPLMRPNTLVVPPTFSLAVPRGSQISVTDKGSIFVVGESLVSLQSYSAGTEHHLTNAIRDSLSFCSVDDYHRTLDTDTASCDAIIMSSGGSTPKTISIMPLSDIRHPAVCVVRVRLRTLASLVPPGTTELLLFSPGSVICRYLSISPSHDVDAAIDLMVGTGCSQLSVAPVYNIVPKHERLWKVSVMTSYKLVTTDPEKSIHSLLTPPPSPKISAVLTEPIPAMSLPVQSNTESRATQLVGKNTVTAAMPPLTLTRKTTVGVVSYLALIASFVVWLLKAGLMRYLHSLAMLSLRRGSDGEIHFHGEEKEICDDSADVDEAASVVSQPSVEEDERSVSTVVDEYVANEGNDEGEMHSVSSSPLLIDIPAGEVCVLLRSSIAGQSLEDVQITLDGNPVTLSTEILADDTSLMRFSGGENGGRVSLVAL